MQNLISVPNFNWRLMKHLYAVSKVVRGSYGSCQSQNPSQSGDWSQLLAKLPVSQGGSQVLHNSRYDQVRRFRTSFKSIRISPDYASSHWKQVPTNLKSSRASSNTSSHLNMFQDEYLCQSTPDANALVRWTFKPQSLTITPRKAVNTVLTLLCTLI